MRRGDQVPDALLPGDAADEYDDRTIRIETDAGDDGLVAGLGRARMPDGGVDPVAHHVDPSGIDERIASSTSRRIPSLTAMIASAYRTALRSDQEEMR